MSDEDYDILLRMLVDKGIVIEGVNKQTGIIQLCGPCSALVRCRQHSGSRHKPVRPW
jgi:hypothetical protein